MWFRLLLTLAVSVHAVITASVSSRVDDHSKDDPVVQLEPLPLILAAPSKVARANRLKDNELNNGKFKIGVSMMPISVLEIPTVTATATKTTITTTTTATPASTTVTTTIPLTTTTEVEDEHVQLTQTTALVTTIAANLTINSTEKESGHNTSAERPEISEKVPTEAAEPSSTWMFFNINNDAKQAEAGNESLKETDRDILDVEVTQATAVVAEASEDSATVQSSDSSDATTTSAGVVEHDYNGELDTKGHQKLVPEELEEPGIVDRGLQIPNRPADDFSNNEDAFVDEPIDLEVAEDRLDQSDTLGVQEPVFDGSEVFYSVAKAPHTRALHGDDISVDSTDYSQNAERRMMAKGLAEPDTPQLYRRSDPTEPVETNDNQRASIGRVEDDLPVEEEQTVEEQTIAKGNVEKEPEGNSTSTAIEFPTEEQSTNAGGISKNLFYNKRFQGGKEVEINKDGSEDKDLIPAESAQNSPTVVDPLNSAAVDVTDDQHPEGDDGDYEYVYEYIDLNSTEIPDDLPDGAFIVTDDNTRIPLNTLKTTAAAPPAEPDTEAPIDESEPVDESASPAPPSGPRFPSFRDYPAGPSLSTDESTTDVPPLVSSPSSLPAAEAVTQASSSQQLPFIPGMPDSPVYFVGIQREKMTNDSAPLPKETPSERNLVSLYALSKALPLDEVDEATTSTNDTMVASVDIAEVNSTEESVATKIATLPAELPDPFDEEFLKGAFETSTPQIETTEATEQTVPTATPQLEEITTPIAKPRSGANKHTGRPARRQTTTTTTTAPATTLLAEETTIVDNGRRPGRFSRRRTTTTTATPVSEAVTTTASDAAVASTERPRSAFGQRGRGGSRFALNRNVQSTENGGKPVEKEKDNDVGTGLSPVVAKVQTSGIGRRPPTRTTTQSAETATAATTRPSLRRRRPTTSAATVTPKTGDSPSPAPGTSDSVGETTTPGRRKLFGSRGRSRVAPKLKPTDNQAGEEHIDQTEASSDQSAPSTDHPPAEKVVEKVESEVAASADAGGSEADVAAEAEVATTTEEASIGHRRFPPRKLRLRANNNGPKPTN